MVFYFPGGFLGHRKPLEPVLEAFERELGVGAGNTTEDGEVTLRTIECAGGCGWGTVVAVNHRYREPVRPEDVPALLDAIAGVGREEPRDADEHGSGTDGRR